MYPVGATCSVKPLTKDHCAKTSWEILTIPRYSQRTEIKLPRLRAESVLQ